MKQDRILLAIVLATLGAALALRIVDPQPVARLRALTFDAYLQAAPRAADPTHSVRIVAIDDAALGELGQWPWPRSVLARLVERLAEAGARVVALDLVLSEPDRLSPRALAKALAEVPGGELLAFLASGLPSGDDRLAVAFRQVPAVVGVSVDEAVGGAGPKGRAAFVFAGDDPRSFLPTYAGVVAPLPELADAALGMGSVNWIPEFDQVVRRVPLVVQAGGTLLPALSLEALRVALGETTVLIASSGASGAGAFSQNTGIEKLRVGGTIVPATEHGELWLNLAVPDPRRFLSAKDVLAPNFDPAEVRGRIVLIGATAVGLDDVRSTPVAAAMPGVEIHAQAIEQMLAGDHLVRPAYATGGELLLIAGMGGLVIVLIWRLRPMAAAAAAAGTAVFAVLLSWTAFRAGGLLLDPLYPTLAVAATYTIGALGTYAKAEIERARVRTAFAHYVAPAVVEEIVRHPEKLVLGGEIRDVTLLFADVRGFSAIAEELDARSLITFVNELFGPLSRAILAEKGTIDKFIGDAVMAFWNAPLVDAAHAANACRAALRMLDELERWNGARAADAARRGVAFRETRIGIGLNSGTCCVGNVGGRDRFDYSVLGDPVNVAARLEALTKIYASSVVAGRSTVALAPDYAFLPLGPAVIRGRSQPEEVYALVGDPSVKASAGFGRLLVAHSRLVTAVEAGDGRAARAALLAAEQAEPPVLARPILAQWRARLEDGPLLAA